jgi:hypothetical protein
MPLITTNRQERLALKFDTQPTLTQLLWPQVKAELREKLGELSPLLQQLDASIGMVLPNEHTTIYYHRLTYAEQKEVNALSTERGQMSLAELWVETCKRCVDGWEHLYDFMHKVIPVPKEATEGEQRQKIAALVETFPSGARQTIAGEALSDTPGELLSAWRAQWSGVSASSTGTPGASSPVPIADASGLKMASAPPATREG